MEIRGMTHQPFERSLTWKRATADGQKMRKDMIPFTASSQNFHRNKRTAPANT